MAGERRLGDYTLVRELGRGGMGVVWAARHPRFGDVALKVVLDAGLGDPDGLARLRREAAALTRLAHPNVVAVHEVGEHGGQPFVAMAFVDGESLHDRLRRGPLDAADAALITLGIARALTYVHGQGVLHRDLKPQNVLVRRDGEPVLVDFGLARLAADRQRLTATGQVVGTPAYMAPEQALGAGRPSTAIDVYGLGATLYEMLCGAPPFTGESAITVMSRVLEEAPTPPSRVHPKVDPELERLCLACLEKDPARRPEAADLADALARWRDAHVGPRGGARRRRRAQAGPSSARALVLGGAAAVGVLAATFAATRDGPSPPTTLTEVAPTPTAVAVGPAPAPDPTPARDDPLELLRAAVPVATHGRAASALALEQARRAARLDPDAPRVLLVSAWVTRNAARAGVEEPPWALLDEAERLVAAAEAAGGAREEVDPVREALRVDRLELERLSALLSAGDLDSAFEAARLCRQLRRHEQAIELFELVRRAAGPARPDIDVLCAYNIAGEVYLTGTRGDEALAAYARVAEIAPSSIDPPSAARYALWCHTRMAEVNVGLSRHAAALDHAEAALRLPRVVEQTDVFGPIDVGKLEGLRALALVHLRRWDEALEAADRAIDTFSRLDESALATQEAVRGAALVGLGHVDEGRRGLTAALVRVRALSLEHFGHKRTVCELARLTFPGDAELEALAQAAFP